MKNAVGREIPDEILAQTGKEIFQGSFHYDQKYTGARPIDPAPR